MKKKMLLFVASILAASLTWAQPAQVQVDIHLSTNASAFPSGALPAYQITLWDLDASGGMGRSFYTDANGDLSMLYTSIHTSGSGYFRYEVEDCQNQLVASKVVNYTSQGAQVVLLDSVFVPCVDPCNVASFTSNNGNQYDFYAYAVNSQRWDMSHVIWDFSDGTTYTGQNLRKQLALGVHSWTLTHQGCVVDSGSINVIGTCNANFSVDTATSGNSMVSMFNNSTATSSANTLYYFWELGDGTTSNLAFPQHQYSGNGPYSIYLQITEVNPLGDTICHSWHGDTLGIDSAGNVFKNGFLLNVMNPNALELPDNKEFVFSVFPQPARDAIRIEAGVKLKYVELIDLNGRLVQEWPLEVGENADLLLTKHPSGMYVLRVHSDQGVSNHKCLIE
jgi:hypothetical protein